MSVDSPAPAMAPLDAAPETVLVVESDPASAAVLAGALARPGRTLRLAAGEAAGIASSTVDRPLLAVFAHRPPESDGLDLCRALRAAGHAGGILVVGRLAGADHAEAARAAGADGFLAEPVAPGDLADLADRILARLANGAGREPRFPGLRLDHARRVVSYGAASAELTGKEADLLACFMSETGPLGRYDIFERVWGGPGGQGGASLNVVDVYVGYLRTKLARLVGPGGPAIQTVRGRGFVLRGPH